MSPRSRALVAAAAATLTVGSILVARPSTATAGRVAGSAATSSFCSRLGHSIQASAGAQMYCHGSQPIGPGVSGATSASGRGGGPANVNAANFSEDVSPNGARAYGQSEVSTAAVGNFVVEAWNDATSFFSPCPSAMNKEEGTGLGFSTNGGASFTDLGGLPNDCTTGFLYEGDPVVEGWKSGTKTFFYIASLYVDGSTGQSDIALDACQATGTTLGCGNPTIVAAGALGVPNVSFPDFLDKEFATLDPVSSRLYVSYTRFSGTGNGTGQIELAVCDLSTPGAPACDPGGSTTPYLVVQAENPDCENEGAYPAVDTATGNVYVAWEFNWATNIFSSSCSNVTTVERLAFIPGSCLTLTPTATCTVTATSVPIVSMDAAFIPGYTRFPMNDFPRIAVSNAHGTVSIVWNDARSHPLGDILLQSFHLGSGQTPVQTAPVRVNTSGAAHFLPALRYTNGNGNLVVGWYERSSANSAKTSFAATSNLNPSATTSATETTISSGPTDWSSVSSDINPNFGDYTDVYTARSTGNDASTDGDDVTGYFAWSDGRTGVPQPYSAHTEVSS